MSEGVALVWNHPQVRAEICELLPCLAERVDLILSHPIDATTQGCREVAEPGHLATPRDPYASNHATY